MKSIFVAVATFVAAIAAQNGIISVTSPLTDTTYTAGKPAIISWVDPKTDIIPKIVLAKGAPTALQPVSTIAENVDSKTGTYTWNIPADITPGNNYAFEFGNSPNLSFTGLFNIIAAGGNASPAAASSINTAASSASIPVCTYPASASASGSSSASNSHASASATSHHKRSVDFESAGLKVSASQAAVGAITVAIAGAAAVAIF